MKKVYSKYRRGDVWYVKLKDELGDNQDSSSVQRKSRPYLIVSCEENNNCAPTFNVIPVTTRPNDHLPMHAYYDYDGRPQLVLCEQITTLSILDFNREGSHYMYSFNLDFMSQIDDALAAQLGLRPRVADMKVLENLIDKISADKEAEMKRKYEDAIQSRVESIAARLAKQFNIELNAQDMLTGATYKPYQLTYASNADKEQIAETAKERMTPPIDKHNISKFLTEQPSQKPANSVVSEKVKKASRTQWTTESMKAYLEDYSHMSVSAMASKYGIAKKSVSQYVYLFKKKLEKIKN